MILVDIQRKCVNLLFSKNQFKGSEFDAQANDKLIGDNIFGVFIFSHYLPAGFIYFQSDNEHRKYP